jgi:TonB family protein
MSNSKRYAKAIILGIGILNIEHGVFAQELGSQSGGADAQATDPMPLNKHDLGPDDYPSISIRLAEQGSVSFQYRVNVDGTVSDVRVIHSSGHPRLDQAAVNVASHWMFTPATKNGIPTTAILSDNLNFKLH